MSGTANFGPPGQQFPLHAADQLAAPERQVDKDRQAIVARRRQQALLRTSHVDRIVELHEIQGLALHDAEQAFLSVGPRMGDAGIADPSRRLEITQQRQLGRRVDKIVNLDQINLVGPQLLE